MSREDKPKGTSDDVVLLGPPTEDQRGVRVIRARPSGLEVGEVRPVEQGKPLSGDLVRLVPRPGEPRVCDVETQFSQSELEAARAAATSGSARPARPRGERALTRSGPAQVSTPRYRDNWDAIYRRPSKPSDLN